MVGQQAVQILPVEFASTQKRIPDLLFLLQDDSIFHLELQGASEDMDWRMLTYYALIRQRYKDKILIQKVLYIGSKAWNPQAVIREKNLFFQYEVIDIRSIDCRLMLASPSLGENILAILCHMENKQETIREILYRISELPTKSRADALTRLLVLSRLRKLETAIIEEAEEMALVFNVMENDVLRPIFRKAEKESEKRGKLKGRQEGGAAILLRQLRRRFGKLPKQIEEKVKSAEKKSIEKWSDKILDAQSIEEVFSGPG
ncbi:MAG: DUF4351 domain-containing protein [Magnetococcus sp. DMHC-1]|nr:DUF4351 domain-containing protein [Magnetococcales bacterium]